MTFYVDNENNIATKTFDHRSGDPYNEYTYDDIGRVTGALYLSDPCDNEAFGMDDLGNRTGTVTLREAQVNFTVDDDTNRYTSIGGDSLTYDDAGNLTTDKDGYKYTYDYENRIIDVNDSSNNNVAEFAYDALGRRIRKIDSKASETTVYYHNDNWQVVCEYDGSDTFSQWYVWGNYIDEVLVKSTGYGSWLHRYYVHDHLYSPAALIWPTGGVVLERYEYNAYGDVSIMSPNYEPRTTSLYGNEYYFTGRRLDTLDNGNLEVMYYRNRYYDTYAARFLQHDPLGITPNGLTHNEFDIINQYFNGLNLYQYVMNNPTIFFDPYGLYYPGPLPIPSPKEIARKSCDDWIEKELKDTSWLNKIPCCPKRLVKSGKNWVNPDPSKWENPDSGAFCIKYHPTATVCMRSKKIGEKCGPGQQCSYACNGNLITKGLGAGTPDKISPIGGLRCFIKHYIEDVKMFDYCKKHLGDNWIIDKYLKIRPPSTGCNP